MSSPNIPVQEILIRYSGSFPISDDAIFNILEQLEEAQALPAHLASQSSRYAVRVVCALLPELDVARPEDALTICGLDHLNEYGVADSMINADGIWAGEVGPMRLRELLLSVRSGEHPDDAASRLDVSEGDLLHINHLLTLPEYWHDEILQEVLMIRHEGGNALKIARHLRSWKPSVVWSWIREARRVEKELRAASAKRRHP